jgi:hypothetical protein
MTDQEIGRMIFLAVWGIGGLVGGIVAIVLLWREQP